MESVSFTGLRPWPPPRGSPPAPLAAVQEAEPLAPLPGGAAVPHGPRGTFAPSNDLPWRRRPYHVHKSPFLDASKSLWHTPYTNVI